MCHCLVGLYFFIRVMAREMDLVQVIYVFNCVWYASTYATIVYVHSITLTFHLSTIRKPSRRKKGLKNTNKIVVILVLVIEKEKYFYFKPREGKFGLLERNPWSLKMPKTWR